ncbi:FecR family protein [Azotobacter chroococcum]|uniref:FecR family protein n=1 Tax=Azotobacter chroococcum TaxID=353 RepID=UPI001F0F92C0|nr:FecR domain-containing protein [Azotobacter chroococcum]
MPLDGLLADLSTATGERRRFVLADGSSVLLNAQSRVDVDFDSGRRRLQLRRGALLAEVTADARRPFVVETPFGRVQALGMRFSVALGERDATVWVQEAQVRLESRSGNSLVLAADEGARFDRDGLPAPGSAAQERVRLAGRLAGTPRPPAGRADRRPAPLSPGSPAPVPGRRRPAHFGPVCPGRQRAGAGFARGNPAAAHPALPGLVDVVIPQRRIGTG